MRITLLTPLLALLPIVGAPSAIAANYIENFTGFTTTVDSFITGGDQSQAVTTSVGTSEGGASAIDGTSLFMTIDTTATPPTTLGNYGGGLRTTITPASLNVGDLSSTTASDYTVVFDISANGFIPVNVDVFLAFRDPSNANVFPQMSVNQGNPAFAPFVALLATNNTVSVSIGLENFLPQPADLSPLVNADRFQFQFLTRSPDLGYSADAGNVLVIDNVGIMMVPEPGSAALLTIASLCLMGHRRRTA